MNSQLLFSQSSWLGLEFEHQIIFFLCVCTCTVISQVYTEQTPWCKPQGRTTGAIDQNIPVTWSSPPTEIGLMEKYVHIWNSSQILWWLPDQAEIGRDQTHNNNLIATGTFKLNISQRHKWNKKRVQSFRYKNLLRISPPSEVYGIFKWELLF